MATFELTRAAGDRLLAGAEAAAVAAAERAGVVVRELIEVPDLVEVARLLRSIWGASEDTGPPLNRDTLRALAHAGNYVAGAYDQAGLRGALVAFLGDNDGGPHLHSHILGVRHASAARGTGFALKLHQRAWALGRGHDVVEWTFDPLVRRNAFFNLTKLAGDLHRYHRDFYGVMGDAQNGDDDSDRVGVRWNLRSERVVAAAAGEPPVPLSAGCGAPPQVVLALDGRGGPRLTPPREKATTLVLQLPEDIVALRRSDPAVARSWRRALRETLTGALEVGYRCEGVTRDGEYVLSGHQPS